MNDRKDILSRIRQMMNDEGIDSFHVLEELVPIEEQMEYFRYFENLYQQNDKFDRDEEVAVLFSPEETIDRKKRSLALLASTPDVGAYRAIETYHSSPLEPELKNWSAIALLGSKILLNSDLSGQNQIYISSGLGGHEHKLRFFSVFATASRENFTELQKEIVEREFRFQLEKDEVEFEKFEIFDNYFTIQMLLPFDADIRSSLAAVIEECNQYGNFLDEKFIFTNVKILSEEEIRKLLKNKYDFNI